MKRNLNKSYSNYLIKEASSLSKQLLNLYNKFKSKKLKIEDLPELCYIEMLEKAFLFGVHIEFQLFISTIKYPFILLEKFDKTISEDEFMQLVDEAKALLLKIDNSLEVFFRKTFRISFTF